MPKRDYDPLSVIPSAATIRKRLRLIQEQARRLRVLLRTAEQIERERKVSATDREGVPHDGD